VRVGVPTRKVTDFHENWYEIHVVEGCPTFTPRTYFELVFVHEDSGVNLNTRRASTGSDKMVGRCDSPSAMVDAVYLFLRHNSSHGISKISLYPVRV
jgi:hypothetical protein